MTTVRVFISATSADLQACREVVKETLLEADVHPVVQEYFPPDHRTLASFLRHEIATCDAVVCLVGMTFGTAALAEPDRLPRSYTQLEYDAARSLQRPVYVFLTREHQPSAGPSPNTPAQDQAQRDHRRRLLAAHKCEFFDTPDELRDQIRSLLARGVFTPRRLEMFYLHPPKAPCYFVGRQDESEQLARALEQDWPSIVVVLGMGGQGKTTLVAQWLRHPRGLPYAAGFWCTAYRDGFTFDRFLDGALAHLLATEFDKRTIPGLSERVTRLISALQEHPVLMVIDGFERWLRAAQPGAAGAPRPIESLEERQGVEPGLDDFLQQVSGLTNGTHLVLTSRAFPSALEAAAHTVVPVYPEPQPGQALRGLDADAAVALLRQMGVRGTPEELAEVARALAYHPLALTVLAVVVKRKHGGLLSQFTGRFASEPRRELATLLEELRQGLPGGRQAEQCLVVTALCLEDPLLATVAAALSATSPAALPMSEQVLVLADWHLLAFDHSSQRLSLHPLIKQHFAGLADTEERRAIHARLAHWYAAQSIPPNAATLEEARPRILAIEHALRAGELGLCARWVFGDFVASQMFTAWLSAWGHQEAGIDLLGRLADAASHPDSAEFRIVRAGFQRQLGRVSAALEELDRALGSFDPRVRKLPQVELPLVAGAWMTKGNVLWESWRLTDAIACYETALTVLGRVRPRGVQRCQQQATVHLNLAGALRDLGQPSRALIECEQALALRRALVDEKDANARPALVQALVRQGSILAELEDWPGALRAYEAARASLEELRDRPCGEFLPTGAQILLGQSAVLSEQGRQDEAFAKAAAAAEILGELVRAGREDLEPAHAGAWLQRSHCYVRRGDWPAALDDCLEAVRRHERLVAARHGHLVGGLATALILRAIARQATNQAPEAVTDREQGFRLLQELIQGGEPETRTLFLRLAAETSTRLATTEPEAALALLERAVAELEHGLVEGHCEEGLAIAAGWSVRTLEDINPELRRTPAFQTTVASLRRAATRSGRPRG